MFDSLPNVLMILFEVFCCKIFYEIFGKVRYKGWINAVQLILLIGSVYGVARGLENIFVLKQIVIIILFAAFMFWHMGLRPDTSRTANVREGSMIMRRVRRSLPDREKGKYIEADNQRYDRERLCRPQQQKIPCKEH